MCQRHAANVARYVGARILRGPTHGRGKGEGNGRGTARSCKSNRVKYLVHMRLGFWAAFKWLGTLGCVHKRAGGTWRARVGGMASW